MLMAFEIFPCAEFSKDGQTALRKFVGTEKFK